MKVHLQFFSGLRDLMEVSELDLEVGAGTTVADLIELLYARTPRLREWDKSILVGAGLEFVDRDYIIKS
ncbi:MAG TPA: hypothetical protein VGI42_01715, partial [Chthoniobacterales bacterium]